MTTPPALPARPATAWGGAVLLAGLATLLAPPAVAGDTETLTIPAGTGADAQLQITSEERTLRLAFGDIVLGRRGRWEAGLSAPLDEATRVGALITDGFDAPELQPGFTLFGSFSFNNATEIPGDVCGVLGLGDRCTAEEIIRAAADSRELLETAFGRYPFLRVPVGTLTEAERTIEDQEALCAKFGVETEEAGCTYGGAFLAIEAQYPGFRTGLCELLGLESDCAPDDAIDELGALHDSMTRSEVEGARERMRTVRTFGVPGTPLAATERVHVDLGIGGSVSFDAFEATADDGTSQGYTALEAAIGGSFALLWPRAVLSFEGGYRLRSGPKTACLSAVVPALALGRAQCPDNALAATDAPAARHGWAGGTGLTILGKDPIAQAAATSGETSADVALVPGIELRLGVSSDFHELPADAVAFMNGRFLFFLTPVTGPIKTAYGIGISTQTALVTDPDGRFERGQTAITPLAFVGGTLDPRIRR